MAVISDVAGDFPNLNKFPGGGASSQFEHEMRHVCESDEYISRVFVAVFGEPLAATSLRFRMLRFGFVNATEHIRKYGDDMEFRACGRMSTTLIWRWST